LQQYDLSNMSIPLVGGKKVPEEHQDNGQNSQKGSDGKISQTWCGQLDTEDKAVWGKKVTASQQEQKTRETNGTAYIPSWGQFHFRKCCFVRDI